MRYPRHEEVLRYLEAFTRRFDLLGLVRLETEVVSVRRDDASAGWKVSYCSRKVAFAGSEEPDVVEEEVFDAVVVCNGNSSEPRVADIPGIDSWPGKQMHSHTYRVPDPFRGQVVVVVGYAPSGIDISRDIVGVAKEVHVACRSPAISEMQSTALPNLWLHPMIERAEEDGSVVFQDDSRVKADAILHCTGYKFNFPFLADDIGIYVDDNRVGPLYKHVFPPHLAPHISFIGLSLRVVVVVGYAPSGLDISRDIVAVAKEVHVARRSPATSETQSTAHANLWLHPMIEHAEEDGSVVFQDGSRVKADVMLHCTGYKYNFPFLSEDIGVFVDDNRVGPLYKHVFPPHLAPYISFVGLSMKALLFPLFQLQSNWVAGVLSGRIELPSQEEMVEDVAAFYSKLEAGGCPKRYTHDLGACTYEYEDWVAEQCGHERIEGWRREMFVAALKNFANRPKSYRDEWDDSHLLPQAHNDFSKYF